MAEVKIMPCGCTHEYQDAKYGAGQRVWNIGKAANGSANATCTVCGATKKITA